MEFIIRVPECGFVKENTMKLKITTLTAGMVLCIGALCHGVVIDEWTFNNDAAPNLSDQGANLQGRWTDAQQAVPQVPGDNVFILAPTNSFFTGKSSLSTAIDTSTYNLVRITVDYTALDFSANPANNAQLQFRFWDAGGENGAGSGDDEWIGLAIQDNFNNDKVFGRVNFGGGLGSSGVNAGRLVNSLGPDAVARTVVMELDFANNEVRMSSPQWQWSTLGGAESPATFTNAVDLSSVASIDRIQSNFSNWTAGDTITLDNLVVEAIPEPATLGLLASFGITALVYRRMKMKM
jgi:hypothetical protein